MNIELKQRWATALRSGQYKQGTHRLNRNGKHCCLGVLCEVLELPKDDEVGDTVKVYTYNNFRMISNINSDLAKDIELSLKERDHLVSMNDCDNRNFNEIADYIEKDLT
jgi:hypothetical protein